MAPMDSMRRSIPWSRGSCTRKGRTGTSTGAICARGSSDRLGQRPKRVNHLIGSSGIRRWRFRCTTTRRSITEGIICLGRLTAAILGRGSAAILQPAWIATSCRSSGTLHVVREHPRNQNLLFAGTEFGLWVSWDRGANWAALKNNFPTVPVDDIEIQARENDLVLATHGRSIWVFDD